MSQAGTPLGAAARTYSREEEAWLQAPFPEINQTWKPSGWREGRAADGPEAWAGGLKGTTTSPAGDPALGPHSSRSALGGLCSNAGYSAPAPTSVSSKDRVLLGELS